MPDITDKVFEALGVKRPVAAYEAAAAITPAAVEELFVALHSANKLFDSSPDAHRAGALAALAAFRRFMPAAQDQNGQLSRPLALLIEELGRAPPPALGSGDILPPFQPGQALEANRRADVDRLVACCVYAARKLSLKRARLKKGKQESRFLQAARDVAEVCAAYDFPRGFYADSYGKRGKKRKVGTSGTPTFQIFVSRLAEWSKRFPATPKAGAAVLAFRTIQSENPLGSLQGVSHDDRRDIVLDWLQEQLIGAGYRSAWNGLLKFGGSQPGELLRELPTADFIPDWAPTK